MKSITQDEKLSVMVGYAATMSMLMKAAEMPDIIVAKLGLKILDYVENVTPTHFSEAQHEAKSLMNEIRLKTEEVNALKDKSNEGVSASKRLL